uniref:Uncharacterized protein n=1 Tax=Romanomermis culicivorax TaxID=13658 RepID=A0A915HJD8_ROMCU
MLYVQREHISEYPLQLFIFRAEAYEACSFPFFGRLFDIFQYNLDIDQNTGCEHVRVHFTGIGLIETDDNGFRGQHEFVECGPIVGSGRESVEHDSMSSREPELKKSSDTLV